MAVLATILANLPDYMQADHEVVTTLESVDYAAFCRLLSAYTHQDDKHALTVAWNAVATARRSSTAIMRCRDCGAYGHTDARGLGISCGCAAE